MRRSAWWLPLACTVALGVAPAVAQTAPELDIRVERDTRPRPSVTELGVYHIVTITERATGQPPGKAYDVFAQATNEQGEKSPIFNCDHASDTDSRVPRGVYNCTVFVDHGGTWNHEVVVNERRADRSQPPITVAQASVPFELATTEVYKEETDEVETSTTAVAVLWTHVLIAGGWLACAAALAFLALPSLRRRLSSLGVNRIERRLDGLIKLTAVSTAAVIGTGVYLLANETAYTTPLSSSEIDAVFDLPYAKPYFLALGVKLALYALMALAVVPLARGAHRQLHGGLGMARTRPSTPRPSSPAHAETFPARGEGTLLTAPAETAPRVEPAASTLARIAVLIVLVGLLGISLCVTLLKYFHQLIEASS